MSGAMPSVIAKPPPPTPPCCRTITRAWTSWTSRTSPFSNHQRIWPDGKTRFSKIIVVQLACLVQDEYEIVDDLHHEHQNVGSVVQCSATICASLRHRETWSKLCCDDPSRTESCYPRILHRSVLLVL